MPNRTRTYIAAEWDGEQAAIKQLEKWNDSKFLSLSFTNAHDLTQARDESLNCSIKKSLRERLQASKRFVLIVGDNTISARSGECTYCDHYDSYHNRCTHGGDLDFRSYIEYECEMAAKDFNDDLMKVVVLYNGPKVDKSKCPEAVRKLGNHLSMWEYNSKDGKYYWNYEAVKKALSDN